MGYMFVGFMVALVLVLVLVEEVLYVTGMYTYVGTLWYAVLHGTLLGGLLYVFMSPRVGTWALLRRHAHMLSLVGATALLQSFVWVMWMVVK
jgi:hypothetical protein